jgi:hypothetical protein
MSDFRALRQLSENHRCFACDLGDQMVAEIERLRALNGELVAALKAMLHMHGKPQREEWLNNAGFEEAKQIDAQARAAIAKAERKP